MPDSWPPLPRTVPGLGGRIKVLRPVQIDAGASWGEWDAEHRTIKVQRSLPPRTALATLYHELVHAALDDAGLEVPPHLVEPICDTVASAMMQAQTRLFRLPV